MRPRTEVKGFIFSVQQGKRRFLPAVRYPDGKVAKFYKSTGEGVWCGPRIRKSFFQHSWDNVTAESLEQEFLELEAQKRVIAEYDRLMPSLNIWYRHEGYTCKMCGLIVWDRTMHLRDHMSKDLYSLTFAETVTTLWGGEYGKDNNARSTEAQNMQGASPRRRRPRTLWRGVLG